MRRIVTAVAAVLVVAVAAIAYLEHTEPAWWVRLWYPLQYRGSIVRYARARHLDPALVAAVIDRESGFRAGSHSSAGAIGLMQLLPATARGIAERTGGVDFRVSDLYRPDINIRYGTWYLADLVSRYRRDPDPTVLALAAYNAGSANVDRWIAATPPGRPVMIRFAVTRSYVADVLHERDLYRKAYGAELSGRP